MPETAWRDLDLFAPTPEHALLADTLREFVAREVEPQAAAHDRSEAFNHTLFLRAGELGLLGITLPPEHGGAGLDAIAAVQLLEALSTSDPGFALSVLAHGVLFAQNVAERVRRPEGPHPPEGSEWRVDRRALHDRAGRRDRCARDAHPCEAGRRCLRARRAQDVHHERRDRRAHPR
jgi:hypothetical protein